MDLVYICRPGDNEELRYSIRSAVANLPHDRVWVVGSKPDWYTGDFLPVVDTRSKFTNIENITRAIANCDDISEDFVLMNDDFFIIKKIDSVPLAHCGTLKDKIDLYKRLQGDTLYVRLIQETYLTLVKKFKIQEPLNFDIHTPMPMKKSILKKTIDNRGVLARTMYGNLSNLDSIDTQDVKHYNHSVMSSNTYDYVNGDSPYISTEDNSFKDVYEDVLRDTFITPSLYEL